jgi:hypothetical protein
VIALDTNVLARYYVASGEADGADPATEDQRQAARALIESGRPLFLPKTVSLELEWRLRATTASRWPMCWRSSTTC